MKFLIPETIVWLVIAIGGYAEASEKPEDNSASKDNLYHVTLSDGSRLKVICSWTENGRKKPMVDVYLYSKNADNWSTTWIRNLTSVDYTPEREPYYAWVKEMKNRLVIFSPWNNRYSIIDKHTGQVLKRGAGDAVLRDYGSFVPLKLTIPRSHAIALHGLKAVRFSVEMMIAYRQRSTFKLIETIPGSKLKKFYIVRFVTHDGIHPGPAWYPEFVIVWKAESLESINLDDNLTINGHTVRSPTLKNTIYALHPDYSLKPLSFTTKETIRLFSHITDIEKRRDRRLVSSYKLLEKLDEQDPQWKEKLSAINDNDEEGVFPSDSYWKQNVDPHLKIVEPPRESSGSKNMSSPNRNTNESCGE